MMRTGQFGGPGGQDFPAGLQRQRLGQLPEGIGARLGFDVTDGTLVVAGVAVAAVQIAVRQADENLPSAGQQPLP